MIISSIFNTIEKVLPDYTEIVRILRHSFEKQRNLVVNQKYIGIPVSTSLSFEESKTAKATKLKDQSIIFKSKYDVFSFKLKDIVSLEFEILIV